MPRHFNKARRKRIGPPPPPTPEGMTIFNTRSPAGERLTEFVPAHEVQAHCAKKMARYDQMPRSKRDEMKGEFVNARQGRKARLEISRRRGRDKQACHDAQRQSP